MFRCQMCGTIVPAGQSAHKLVVSRRAKVYAPRTKKLARARGYRSERVIDRGGAGHEIVRELMVCGSCSASHADVDPVTITLPVADVEPQVAAESKTNVVAVETTVENEATVEEETATVAEE